MDPSPTRPETILEVEHLTVPPGRAGVLRDLGFALARGTTLAVIGPNGSGKTTLFRALVGTIPYEGEVRWAPGTRVGYVPQKLDLERDLPVRGLDFLRARAHLAHAPAGEIERCLGEVGLAASVAGQPIGALSGGQFHLLLVAAALIGAPAALLLDEPTASLDEPAQARLHERLRRLSSEQRTTVLLISHDLSVVLNQADLVLCLSRRRAWFGPPREVLTPEALREAYGAPVQFHVHD